MIMSSWLFELWSESKWEPSLIVPVPLSRNRLKSRGYNQTSLIAEGLGDLLALEIREDVLFRTRDTKSQVGLDPIARMQNVQDAFTARAELVIDHKILLVDDLVTTGATLSACALALYEAGVQKVHGVAVARA